MFPLHLYNQILDPCFRQTKLSCLSFLFCFFQTLSHFNINHYIKEPCKNRTKTLKKILILALTVIALLFPSHSKKLFPIHQFLDFRFFYLHLFTLFIHLMCFINFYVYRWTHLAVVCYLCCGVSSFVFVYNDWNACVVSNQEFVFLFKRWYTGLFSVLGLFLFFIFMYEIGWVCRETLISKKGAGMKCEQMMRLSV
jgi:hypothetical protein